MLSLATQIFTVKERQQSGSKLEIITDESKDDQFKGVLKIWDTKRRKIGKGHATIRTVISSN